MSRRHLLIEAHSHHRGFPLTIGGGPGARWVEGRIAEGRSFRVMAQPGASLVANLRARGYIDLSLLGGLAEVQEDRGGEPAKIAPKRPPVAEAAR